MNDVDMLLRDTLRDRAKAAPPGTGLLTRVRTRSRLIRRRRRVGVARAGAAVMVLAAAAVPAAVNVTGRDTGGPGGGFGGPAASGPATPTAVTDRPTPSAAPTASVVPVPARLAPPEYRLPVFPFTPGQGAGLGKAQAWVDGEVFLMHPASAGARGAPSVQVYTGAAEPSFDQTPDRGVRVESAPTRVRGVTGTLRTESMTGFVVRSLYWREPSGVWIWVRANDMEPAAMIAYAEGLRAGSVQVDAPMTFDLLPQGLVLDNVGPSDMVFRLPGQPTGGSWQNKLGFVLNADGGADAASWPLRVNGQPAKIHLQDQERSAWVLQKNGTILVIQVPQALVISDEDLLRLAAGVHVSVTAQAGRG